MIDCNDWKYTTDGVSRGYIQPEKLKELWFNTGTACNLNCSFCFEGSNPTNHRLEQITLKDVEPFIAEAVEMGIEKFSFTGGEPFLNNDIISILKHALEYRPCLVLTNATEPLRNNLPALTELRNMNNLLSFRISIDSPTPEEHDKNRGAGHFNMSMNLMKVLCDIGFKVSIARQIKTGEKTSAVEEAYSSLVKQYDLPTDTLLVSFPDLLPPCSTPEIPQITENCMTTYKSEDDRKAFMCNYSKMIIKKEGKMSVYACTLVDDDANYDLGYSLHEAMSTRVMLKHHRCFTCFSSGTSCSEG